MIHADTFGAPNWVDLSTPDIDGAVEFYRELFDWELGVTKTDMGEYHVAKVGDQQVAGLMAQPPHLDGAPAHWTMFVYVQDVDRTLEQVEEAFGHIMQAPFEIPGGARVSVVSDTTGAMFALISGGDKPQGSFFSNQPGGVCWFELMTRDPDAAIKFYADVFGWDMVVDATAGTDYMTFQLAGNDLVGVLKMPDTVPDVPNHWAVYFTTVDCAATQKMALELGGEVIVPTTDISIGRFAVLADPQGGSFDIMEFVSVD